MNPINDGKYKNEESGEIVSAWYWDSFIFIQSEKNKSKETSIVMDSLGAKETAKIRLLSGGPVKNSKQTDHWSYINMEGLSVNIYGRTRFTVFNSNNGITLTFETSQ